MKRKVGRIFVICLILMMINPHSIHAEEPRQEARELEAKRVNQFFTDEINALIDAADVQQIVEHIGQQYCTPA